MTTETKVGVFVVTALVLLAVTIYGVHATQTVRGQVPFKTYLRDAGGLDADTSVLFGGIKVGRITTVRPDTDDPTRIEIAFEVKAVTPMNRQSTARVATVSLMGSPALLITTGSNEAPRLAPGDVVSSEEGVNVSDLIRRVGTVVDNANNVLLDLHREIPAIAAQVRTVLDNVDTLTGAENQQQIRTVLAGVRTLVNDTDAVIVSAKPLMANIDQTVSNVNRTFDSVRERSTRPANRSSTISKRFTTRSRMPAVRSAVSNGWCEPTRTISPRRCARSGPRQRTFGR